MSTLTCEPPETKKIAVEIRPTAPELWKKYHKRATTKIENQLVEQYLPLVATVLGRLAMNLPDHVDQDDLRSAGLMGLLQAMRNFDPQSGTSFETYARVRIRGSMLDELRRMDWVPRTIHEKARKVQAMISKLEQKYSRTPTEKEMAKALELSADEYSELLEEIRPAAFVCLDAVCSSENGDSGSLYEVISDGAEEGPSEETSKNELKRIILARLKDLPDMQRKVLALYYGEDLRLREIAEAFGVTESRICQIHAQAILSIRAYLQRFEAGMSGRTTAQVS